DGLRLHPGRGDGGVRAAGDHHRHDAGGGGHAAAGAGAGQVQGDGDVPDRTPHGRCRGGAQRVGGAGGAGGGAAGGGGADGGQDRGDVAAGDDDGEGGGEHRLRDAAGRGAAVRAAGVPIHVCHGGPARGHGGIRGEAEAELQAPVEDGFLPAHSVHDGRRGGAADAEPP